VPHRFIDQFTDYLVHADVQLFPSSCEGKLRVGETGTILLVCLAQKLAMRSPEPVRQKSPIVFSFVFIVTGDALCCKNTLIIYLFLLDKIYPCACLGSLK
jgi:hypothetical protein